MATPARRSQAASDAAHASWAVTPDRAARTAPATQASPVQLDYWIARLSSERVYASEQDLEAAARNALTVEMRRRGRAGVEARRRNKALKQQAADGLAATA